MENNLIVTLRTLSFDSEGSGQRDEVTLPASVQIDGQTMRLCYVQEEEGAVAKTVISFESGTPCVVEMEQSGARACFMRFSAGQECRGEYRVAGLPTFPFTVKTRAVENALTPQGGRMLLDYEMTFGGARTRMRLTLLLKQKEASV